MKKHIFYILSFTWGLPITLVGCIIALALNMMGHKPNGKYGYCWVFKVGNNWGGASFGPIMITGQTVYKSVQKHEHGHAIQNCWFGPLMPFIVSIPSAIRYWYREFRYLRKGKTPPTAYDDAWFEGQASRVGAEFINKYFE